MLQGGCYLEGNYPLDFGGRTVGKVQVLREGLYWRFHCRCRLAEEIISKVIVSDSGKEESLGVLVPEGGGFRLDTRLPCKRLAGMQWQFQVIPIRPAGSSYSVPIRPEEPFAYLDRLKNAYLAMRDGQAVAVLDMSLQQNM